MYLSNDRLERVFEHRRRAKQQRMCGSIGGLGIALITIGSCALIVAPIAFGLFFGLAWPEMQLLERSVRTQEGECIHASNNLNVFIGDYYSSRTAWAYVVGGSPFLAAPTIEVLCYGILAGYDTLKPSNRSVFRTMNPDQTYTVAIATSWINSLPPINSSILVYYDSADLSAPLFYSTEWSSKFLGGAIAGAAFGAVPASFIVFAIVVIIYKIYRCTRYVTCYCPTISCSSCIQCCKKCRRSCKNKPKKLAANIPTITATTKPNDDIDEEMERVTTRPGVAPEISSSSSSEEESESSSHSPSSPQPQPRLPSSSSESSSSTYDEEESDSSSSSSEVPAEVLWARNQIPSNPEPEEKGAGQ